jgi:hypothetical protein
MRMGSVVRLAYRPHVRPELVVLAGNARARTQWRARPGDALRDPPLR